MPRYYFDVHENLALFRDVDGLDFDNDAAARKGAVGRLVDVLSSIDDLGPETRLIVVVVRRMGDREPFAAVSTRITSLLDQ